MLNSIHIVLQRAVVIKFNCIVVEIYLVTAVEIPVGSLLESSD